MVDEMTSLDKNEAWDLVELSVGSKPIGRKWVFKKKMNAEDKVDKYKSRLVAKVEQMDVKITFIQKDLKEEIYMKQPKDFALKGKKEWDGKPVKVPIPVGVNLSAEQCLKTQKDVEDMSHVPYASAVGSQMYAMVCTRPDLAHAMGVLSRFMSKPGKEHWKIVKRGLRYFNGTSDYGLCYQGRLGLEKALDIHGFVDADWARDLDQKRSTSGYAFKLFGGEIS
eukprot:PITA_02020